MTDMDRIMTEGCSPYETAKMSRRVRWAHENMGNPLLGAEAEIEALEDRLKKLEKAARGYLAETWYPEGETEYYRQNLINALEEP